jgi:hypothetical protein
MQSLRPVAGRILRAGVAAARRLRPGSFTFAGREYRYFEHPYNETWRNGRAVELPIVLGALDERPGARVLELGNVLATTDAARTTWSTSTRTRRACTV